MHPPKTAAAILGEEIRSQFPIFESPRVYLDSAATTHKPRSVMDEMTGFYSYHYGTVHRAVYDLSLEATQRYNSVRAQVQRFLNAQDSSEIIFTRGTTEAINLVAYAASKVFLEPGDEVLISSLEHHANLVPWQQGCSERGCALKIIPLLPNGTIDLEAYVAMFSPKVKIVALAHVANSIGTELPIADMIRIAHAYGALVLVDGAQSAGHMPIDVQALDADFYAFSAHKIYGPTGVGILYGKRHLLEKMPPLLFGGDMVDHVTWQAATFQQPPLKFEAGTPMIAEVLGLGAAIAFLDSLGKDQIHSYESSLTQYAWSSLSSIPGVTLYGPEKERGSLIGFSLEGVHPLDIGTLLNAKGIAVRTGTLCAQPVMQHFSVPGMVRISFGVYNTFHDIDIFLSSLQSLLPFIQER